MRLSTTRSGYGGFVGLEDGVDSWKKRTGMLQVQVQLPSRVTPVTHQLTRAGPWHDIDS